jgi:hypothetical protein
MRRLKRYRTTETQRGMIIVKYMQSKAVTDKREQPETGTGENLDNKVTERSKNKGTNKERNKRAFAAKARS